MSTEIKMMKLNGLKITVENDYQYYSYDTGEKSNTVVKYGIYAKMVDIKDETEVNVFLGFFDETDDFFSIHGNILSFCIMSADYPRTTSSKVYRPFFLFRRN